MFFSFAAFALPKDDFTHTLTLAKYSACKDIVEVIQKTPRLTKEGCPIGRGGFLQSKLKALSSGPFPYRFEITNGYQEGFVYYALLGYANELSGDIPFAYRCYQNSLDCIDEDKSFSHPLPRAEIHLAIGRTCLAAGRYMDAKDWLDNAFLEADDNLQLQAAIDRVGIQRANEIGDYDEACELYEELGTFTILSHEQFNVYVKELFSLGRDRIAFKQILKEIGICSSYNNNDNNIALINTIKLFLKRMPDATDDEIIRFYELLGCVISKSSIDKKEVKFLSFVCRTRLLLAKVFPFLDRKNDLALIKHKVKNYHSTTNIVKKYNHKFKSKNNKSCFHSRNFHTDDLDYFNENAPEFFLELKLMQADYYYNKGDKSKSVIEYKHFLNSFTNEAWRNILYDGLSYQEMAYMAQIHIMKENASQTNLTLLKQIISKMPFSSRGAQIILSYHIKCICKNNYDENLIKNALEYMTILPRQSPIVMEYIHALINYYIIHRNFDNAINYFCEYENRIGACTYKMYIKWFQILVAQGKTAEAFRVLLQGFSNVDHFPSYETIIDPINEYPLKELAYDYFAWASDNDLKKFNEVYLNAGIYKAAWNPKPVNMKKILKAIRFEKVCKNELLLRQTIKSGNWPEACLLLTNSFSNNIQPAHQEDLAIVSVAMLDLTNAYKAATRSYKMRCSAAADVGDDICYPVKETHVIEQSIRTQGNYEIKKYTNWLIKRLNDCKAKGREDDVQRIKKTLSCKPFSAFVKSP
ncbi:MAG: hypothetical protein DRI74_08535 [Bacteroidetes bacterium]|nr:MAG: hypothetical protein DRI74_08535 [Bacteroidota bacterium]